MKAFLLFAVGGTITVATKVIPNVPAKLIVSAFILIGALATAARRAPVGYEDGSSLHLVHARRPVTKHRAKLRVWPSRKKLVLLSDSHQRAKA